MKRILVLDASAQTRTLLEERLRAEGFLVETGEDGGQGLARIAAAPPDAVVLDVTLPTVSGFEVLARLKASASTRGIPTYVFTDKVFGSDRRRANELGADGFFIKPAEIDALVERLRP